jgi:hypothetical protein
VHMPSYRIFTSCMLAPVLFKIIANFAYINETLVVQSRGSSRDGTGVHDSIVNQLLTKVLSPRIWTTLCPLVICITDFCPNSQLYR